MTTNLIIAPHIDDEMIGCYSVLRDAGENTTVVYLKELEPMRMEEAMRASDAFSFTPLFDPTVLTPEFVTSFDEVYIPSRRDWHRDHKQANRDYRQYATKFYSIDMAHGVTLADAMVKLSVLDMYYPTQCNLWARNDKYWLFEDIQDRDYDVFKELAWSVGGYQLTVRVLTQYADWVNLTWYPALSFTEDGCISRASIDALLSHCDKRILMSYKSLVLDVR